LSKKKRTKRKKVPEVDISDSTNTAVIVGDRNVVTQNVSSTQPVEMPTDSDDFAIRIGKWLMLKLYGTLKHSMKPFGVITSLLAVGIAIPAFSTNWLMQEFGATNFTWVWVAFLLPLAATLFFGPYIFLTSHETTCPKCGWKFSWIQTKKILKRHVELSDREVRNYESTYECTNPACKFKRENVPEVVTRNVS
jgi:hypothetical protein